MPECDSQSSKEGAILFYGGGGLAQEMHHTLTQAEPNYNKCTRLLLDGADQDLPHFIGDGWIRFRQIGDVIQYLHDHRIETLAGFVCVRDAGTRIRMVQEMDDLIGSTSQLVFPTLLHPNASISKTAVLERGVYVGPFSHVGPNAHIKQFAMLTACVIVGHGSTVGEYCYCSPMSCILGDVKIDSEVTLGAASCVREKCTVVNGTAVGMGATVTRSIKSPGIYFGTPAIFQKSKM